jgi:hypothetical protein
MARLARAARAAEVCVGEVRMKLGVPFLQFPLQFDAGTLAAEIQAIDESAWRPHPAGYAGNDALLLVTVDGDPATGANAHACTCRSSPSPPCASCVAMRK